MSRSFNFLVGSGRSRRTALIIFLREKETYTEMFQSFKFKFEIQDLPSIWTDKIDITSQTWSNFKSYERSNRIFWNLPPVLFFSYRVVFYLFLPISSTKMKKKNLLSQRWAFLHKNFLKMLSWLAATCFSFWYWKSGRTVTKTPCM